MWCQLSVLESSHTFCETHDLLDWGQLTDLASQEHPLSYKGNLQNNIIALDHGRYDVQKLLANV